MYGNLTVSLFGLTAVRACIVLLIVCHCLVLRSVRQAATEQFCLIVTRCVPGQKLLVFFITLLFTVLQVCGLGHYWLTQGWSNVFITTPSAHMLSQSPCPSLFWWKLPLVICTFHVLVCCHILNPYVYRYYLVKYISCNSPHYRSYTVNSISLPAFLSLLLSPFSQEYRRYCFHYCSITAAAIPHVKFYQTCGMSHMLLTYCVLRSAQLPGPSVGQEMSSSLCGLRSEGLVWLIGALVCLLFAYYG